jgi:hypothetical protein
MDNKSLLQVVCASQNILADSFGLHAGAPSATGDGLQLSAAVLSDASPTVVVGHQASTLTEAAAVPSCPCFTPQGLQKQQQQQAAAARVLHTFRSSQQL